MMLFSFICSVFESAKTRDRIFITSTDFESSRTLLIEEDENSVWAYLLKPNKEGIDFDGFICAVKNPKAIQAGVVETTKNGSAPALTSAFANKYSFIKKLRKQDIKIVWNDTSVSVCIKDDVYLVMNLNTKMSYSKGISKSGPYGEPFTT